MVSLCKDICFIILLPDRLIDHRFLSLEDFFRDMLDASFYSMRFFTMGVFPWSLRNLNSGPVSQTPIPTILFVYGYYFCLKYVLKHYSNWCLINYQLCNTLHNFVTLFTSFFLISDLLHEDNFYIQFIQHNLTH